MVAPYRKHYIFALLVANGYVWLKLLVIVKSVVLIKQQHVFFYFYFIIFHIKETKRNMSLLFFFLGIDCTLVLLRLIEMKGNKSLANTPQQNTKLLIKKNKTLKNLYLFYFIILFFLKFITKLFSNTFLKKNEKLQIWWTILFI